VKAIIHGDLPTELMVDRTVPDWQKKEYIWAPERFEHFVDRCATEIKKQLGNANMTREEMLSALCFGDYEAHKTKTEQLVLEGKLPVYRAN
jgi:hypothetical protein